MDPRKFPGTEKLQKEHLESFTLAPGVWDNTKSVK